MGLNYPSRFISMIRPIRFWFLLFFCVLAVMAEKGNQFYAFVESLENNSLTKEAITEYQRYLFLNKDLNNHEKGKIWLRLGVCYRKINMEAEMMNAFGLAFQLLGDSHLIKLLYEEITIFLLSRGKADLARVFIDKLYTENPDKRIDRYICLSYLIEKKWDPFFQVLNRLELSKNQINEARNLVNKMKYNQRRYQFLRVINIFFPGIVYACHGDFLNTGESFLFHFYFMQQVFSDSTLIGKAINGIGLCSLYLKTNNRDRQFLKQKFNQKNLQLEAKIFSILFE